MKTTVTIELYVAKTILAALSKIRPKNDAFISREFLRMAIIQAESAE